MAPRTEPLSGRAGARITLRDGIACCHGLRYGRLSVAGNPRSPVAPADGQIEADDVTCVPVFPQLPSRLERVMGPAIRDNPQDEAAFFVNVWAPAGARDLPVLVFLHGGAWVSGGGAARWYRGARLAAEGLVVVTVNYRLGPAGHLEDGPGQAHRPVGDLLAALDWVRTRIGGFGGDPARVTLAGQSAGAWYAWALAGSTAARGLFRQVALLSIPGIRPWTVEHRRAFTQEVEALRDTLVRAGDAPALALLRAGAQVLARTPHAPGSLPPMYLPVWPQARAEAATPLHVEALYVRVTTHEMSVFLPDTPNAAAGAPGEWPQSWARNVAEASWAEFGRFAEAIATAAEARGSRVIRREFAALAGPPELGAAHCFDLPFQFGNLDDWHAAPMLAGWPDEAFHRLSRAVVRDLADFVIGRPQAATGCLGAGAGPHPFERRSP